MKNNDSIELKINKTYVRKSEILSKEGITLVALIITIIILLILAGVILNLTLGDNGIFRVSKEATQSYKLSEIEEELNFKIEDIHVKKIEQNLDIKREDLMELIDIGATIEKTEVPSEVEYKDYLFEIDEDYNITMIKKLEGAKPKVTVTILTEGNDVEVEIQVVATTEEGEIQSIEAINGARLKTENSNTNKIFIVDENNEYFFKITGTNGRNTIVKTSIDNVIIAKKSILEAISEINTNGQNKIRVIAKDNTKTKRTEDYILNMITYTGDLILDGERQVDGATLTQANKLYKFGNGEDIATGTSGDKLAKRTVVLKVNGNLIINEGVTVTSVESDSGYGGPKGLIIYVTGKITNNGTITMSQKGAYANPQDVYLWQNIDKIDTANEYEYVPKYGANGATTNVTSTATYQYVYPNANAHGTGRQTAGGASGGAGKIGSGIAARGGNGGRGTSYSGGGGRRRYCNKR